MRLESREHVGTKVLHRRQQIMASSPPVFYGVGSGESPDYERNSFPFTEYPQNILLATAKENKINNAIFYKRWKLSVFDLEPLIIFFWFSGGDKITELLFALRRRN